MARILLPQQWSAQPQVPVILDRSNPLTRGIIDAFLPINGIWRSVPWALGLPDLTTAQDQSVLADTASPTYAATPQGAYGKKYNGSTQISVRASCPIGNVQELSMAVLAVPTNPGTATLDIFAYGNSGNTNPKAVLMQGGTASNLSFTVTNTAGTSQNTQGVPGTGLWNAGLPSLIIGTRSQLRNYHRTYVNGALIVDTTATTVNTTALNTAALGGINRNGSNALFWGGSLFLAVAWDRGLDPAECNEFTVNPWQIFAKQPRKIFVQTIATGVSGTAVQTLAGVSQSATGALPIKASAVEALASVGRTATAALTIKANGAKTLSAIAQSATGSGSGSGVANQTLAGVTPAGTGKLIITGQA